MRQNIKRLPGPKGHWLLGSLRERNADAIGFFANCFADHGDFFRVRLLHIPVHMTARPALAKEILFDRPDEFVRKRVFEELSALLGRGILTSDGERWRRHRRLMQPAFHTQSLESFFALMVQNTEALIATWQDATVRGPIQKDIVEDLMRLTLRIVSQSLFGFDTIREEAMISANVEWILPQIFLRLEAPPFLNKVPTARNREFNRRLAELDQIIFSIIDSRLKSGEVKHDLLGMLMAAVDEEDQSKLNKRDLRDQVMTLFLAGHETTANALAWTFHLLADHPEVLAKMREEIQRVIGDGPIELRHIRELTYVRMVFEEAMRLHPPVWAIPRTSIKDTTLGGTAIPKGSIVSVNTFLIHRNPEVFENPLKFDPERFAPEKRKQIDRFSYLPFGAGPHICIGSQFALMEAQVILALLLRRFDFARPRDAEAVRMRATITMRPEPGIVREIRAR